MPSWSKRQSHLQSAILFNNFNPNAGQRNGEETNTFHIDFKNTYQTDGLAFLRNYIEKTIDLPHGCDVANAPKDLCAAKEAAETAQNYEPIVDYLQKLRKYAEELVPEDSQEEDFKILF